MTSTAALAVLQWSFVVNFVYLLTIGLNGLRNIFLEMSPYSLIVTSIFTAVVHCFYPLAGHLADTKFGRYKTVTISLWVIVPGLVITAAGIVPILLGIDLKNSHSAVLSCVIVTVASGLLLVMTGIAGFKSNVIQFGLDQVHDSPVEDQSLFIHWYMWTIFGASGATKIIVPFVHSDFKSPSFTVLALLGVLVPIITLNLVVSLCVSHWKRRRFHIEPIRTNPYKLVYRVSAFAFLHKVPICRSAFTYCEDEIPSGLDLGKEKYGGPFTTEEVEDVKSFYGILKVLFSLGPMFFMDIGRDSVQYSMILHSASDSSVSVGLDFFLKNDLVYPIIGCLAIPIHLVIIHPIIRSRVSKILRRLGVGVLLTLILMLISLSLDTVVHVSNPNLSCVLSSTNDTALNVTYSAKTDYIIKSALLFQQCLRAVSHMFLYIAMYEFLCSQSPHSMKGLLIGLSFAVRGVFETIAALLVLPYAIAWHRKGLPSCGMAY